METSGSLVAINGADLPGQETGLHCSSQISGQIRDGVMRQLLPGGKPHHKQAWIWYLKDQAATMARLLGLPLTSGVLALHKDRDHFKMVQDRVNEGILCMNPTKHLVKQISEEALVWIGVSVLIYYSSSKLIYYNLLIYNDRMGLSY